jgi:hypothetical protein
MLYVISNFPNAGKERLEKLIGSKQSSRSYMTLVINIENNYYNFGLLLIDDSRIRSTIKTQSPLMLPS